MALEVTGSTDDSVASVGLRLARGEDVQPVRRILAAAASDLTARFGIGHWSGVGSAETLRKYVEQGSLYVVQANDAAVGTLRLTERKPGFYRGEWFADPKALTCYLFDMAIDPPHRRRGAGRQAMRLAEELARSRGLAAIRLDAYGGPAGAGRFYEKCGFRQVYGGDFKGVALEYFEKLVAYPA
jgi:GNAT superfamily N-acetyltransferase